MNIAGTADVPRRRPLLARDLLCDKGLKQLLTKSRQSAVSLLRLYTQGVLLLEE
jgi:hypothetical protein